MNTVVFRKALERRWTMSENVARRLVQAGYASTFTPNRYRRRTGGKVYTQYMVTLTSLGEAVRAAEGWPSHG